MWKLLQVDMQTEVADQHVQVKAGLGNLHTGSSVDSAFGFEGWAVWIHFCSLCCLCNLLLKKKKKEHTSLLSWLTKFNVFQWSNFHVSVTFLQCA